MSRIARRIAAVAAAAALAVSTAVPAVTAPVTPTAPVRSTTAVTSPTAPGGTEWDESVRGGYTIRQDGARGTLRPTEYGRVARMPRRDAIRSGQWSFMGYSAVDCTA